MNRWTLTLLSIAAVSVCACQKNQETAYSTETYEPLDHMDTATAGDSAYEADPYAADTTTSDPYATDPLVTPQPEEDVIIAGDSDEPTVRTHTVSKGDTLYKLAREYYGDEREWRTIWDANRGRISNPDRLAIGTRLVIP